MNGRRITLAALAAAATAALAPGAAQAATETVTGDDGNPAGLTPGAPLTIRNMNVTVGTNRGADAVRYRRSIVAPDGVSLISDPTYCWSIPSITDGPDYRGNGTYTVTVTEYSNDACTTALRQTVYQYAVAAGVAITPPPGVFQTRAKNSFSSNTLELLFSGNPGAFGYDVEYARDGVVGPDGAISGPSAPAFVDSTTGRIKVSFSEAGSYTMVARANGGDFNSPWSAPITIRAKAPFDLSGSNFTDGTGPSYKIRGDIREKSARGKVKIAIAKGKRGGRFHSIGKAKIRSNGSFSKRFRHRGLGRYRIRYTFKGSSTVLKGSVTVGVRFSRHLVF